jgi:hypothetical protein
MLVQMSVRACVLELLAAPETDTRHGAAYFPERVRERVRCRPHEVWEALWGLVGEGLIFLDPAGQQSADSQDNWRWRLSSVGITAVSGGSWEPREPEGYLRRLRKTVPGLDPIIDGYVEEALRAFNARCYLSASVMLGVASEQAFLKLAITVAAALGTEAARLAKTLDDPRASQHTRFIELRKLLEPRRSRIPGKLADTLTLDAVSDLLRITRNEAGHPTGASIDENTARTHLLIAGGYLQKMAELQQHFADGSSPALVDGG